MLVFRNVPVGGKIEDMVALAASAPASDAPPSPEIAAELERLQLGAVIAMSTARSW